eukprot:708480-Rhodomonas_salina.1
MRVVRYLFVEESHVVDLHRARRNLVALHTLAQNRTPRSAIRWLSTAHRVASYASSVPDIAEGARRTICYVSTGHRVGRKHPVMRR